MHKTISIDDIEASKNKELYYEIEENIADINAVTPICANLTFKSLGDFIEVNGKIKGVVKLQCDLCLEEFEYNLNFDIDEIYAKYTLINDCEEAGQEIEIKEGQFVTDLYGKDEIDIYDLLYQSVILNLPNKKVCGINCKGNKFLKEENLTDPRLDVFKNIKIK